MVDSNKVIERLTQQIAILTKENAILRVALEEAQEKEQEAEGSD